MPAHDVLESIPAEFGPPDRREERIAVGTKRIGLFVDPRKDMLFHCRPPCRDGPWIRQHPCMSQGGRFWSMSICP